MGFFRVVSGRFSGKRSLAQPPAPAARCKAVISWLAVALCRTPSTPGFWSIFVLRSLIDGLLGCVIFLVPTSWLLGCVFFFVVLVCWFGFSFFDIFGYF